MTPPAITGRVRICSFIIKPTTVNRTRRIAYTVRDTGKTSAKQAMQSMMPISATCWNGPASGARSNPSRQWCLSTPNLPISQLLNATLPPKYTHESCSLSPPAIPMTGPDCLMTGREPVVLPPVARFGWLRFAWLCSDHTTSISHRCDEPHLLKGVNGRTYQPRWKSE